MRTRTRDLDGMIFVKDKCAPAVVTLRATRDNLGQTISLAVEDMNLMILIPVEPVEDILEVKK